MIFGLKSENGSDLPCKRAGQGYKKDSLYEMAQEYLNTVENIQEQTSLNLGRKPLDVINSKIGNATLKDVFVEACIDKNQFGEEESDDAIKEAMEDMEQLFDNDVKGINEWCAMSEKNPVIGMGLLVHKNILINCPYDKGVIQKVVAASPRFPVDLEYRYIVTPQGEYIDMWKDQYKISQAIDATVPDVEVDINLPEDGSTDILDSIGASSEDHLSIDSRVTAVKVTVTKENGDTEDRWLKVKGTKFNPAYGNEFDRVLTKRVDYSAYLKTGETVKTGSGTPITSDVLQGTLKDDKVTFNANKGTIKAIKFQTRKDASNGLVDTCSVAWKVTTDLVEIPDAKPINITISPDEIKDIGALYKINQLTKNMNLMKLSLENYKDDKIKSFLDDSYEGLEDDYRFHMNFDMLPRDGYYSDHVNWRQDTFMDACESCSTDMLDCYNDPNMVINYIGRPDLIRKLRPVEWSYKSPEKLGTIPLEYEQVVVTNADRVYNFVSTRKMNRKYLTGLSKAEQENDLIGTLSPKNSDRIMYRIYDYMMYISNEVRNAKNPTLPSIHAYERWAAYEMQPVQSRITILHPNGLDSDSGVPVHGTGR